MIKLMKGDCLDRMKEIESGSVDAIICDPPYGTTACKWDSIIPLDPMWEQLKRIVKPSSNIVLTSSQPFTTKLISSNYDMFKYTCVWRKNRATKFLSSKVNPLNNHEDICVFNYRPHEEFAKHLKMKRVIKGYSKSYMDKVLGSNTLYSFFEGRTLKGDVVYSKPNKRHYDKMKACLDLDCRWDMYIESECTFNHINTKEVQHQIKSSRKKHAKDNHYSFNSEGYTKTKEGFSMSVLDFNLGSGNVHPTQKPVALMEYLIKTYTNEGDTVLDFACGSGTTGVACVNTNRSFIGIEMDDKYFDIAKNRIDSAKSV